MDSLAETWPLFGLRISTARLELRLPREEELPALARAGRVIAAPGEPQLQMQWMYGPSPGMERDLLQWHWRALAHWKADSWNLPLAVFADGEPIGRQDLFADDFRRVRSVGTGSWLTRSCQGQGYGSEARAAVLELAFGSSARWRPAAPTSRGTTPPRECRASSATFPTGRRPCGVTGRASSPSTGRASTAAPGWPGSSGRRLRSPVPWSAWSCSGLLPLSPRTRCSRQPGALVGRNCGGQVPAS